MKTALQIISVCLTLHLSHGAGYAQMQTAEKDHVHTVLWAWEQPEDLRFLEGENVAVAFLARTIVLTGREAIVHPRLQLLEVSPSNPLIAVVRIEVRGPTDLSESLGLKTMRAIMPVTRLKGVTELQIDFDAKRSERDFYRVLLKNLRRSLPPTQRLTMTALVSWCVNDGWLSALPVDEAIPMIFRMGTGQGVPSVFYSTGAGEIDPICRGSIGMSTDEPSWPPVANRRAYIFHPGSWTMRDYQTVKEELIQ